MICILLLLAINSTIYSDTLPSFTKDSVILNPFSNLKKEYCHRSLKRSDSLTTNTLSLEDTIINKTVSSSDSGFINQNFLINSQASASEITSNKTSGSKFYLNGSKTLGVSIDSRKNVEFDQSTQLSLNGNMGSDVNVEGVLNDDNLPIQPEGSTQELKQLDEMYIKINKGNSKLKFGDINFNNQTHFGTLNRELEGITGELATDTKNQNKSNMLLGGAISKGKWIKKEFQGKFGKQGPYELSSQYTVIAGSEKVALNGNYLKRGKEYTIDYSDGSLTFTNTVPIKDEDKIIVSFQEKEDEYKNSVYMANGKLNKSGTLKAMLFKEKDIIDAHQPANFQNISYDSLYGWVSGATFKGTNKGSYTKKDSVYEYAGYNKGDYEISFTVVNKGDYKFDPFVGGYKYAGKDSGDYIPMIKVSLPQDKLVMDIDYSCQAKGIDFTLAGGATQFSPNTTLGQSNANQKTGKAFLTKIETKKSLWGAGISARTIDSTFYFPGTTDTLDRVYGEVFGSVAPITPLRFGIDGKMTKTATDIKPQLGINISPYKFPSLYYKYNGGKTNNTNEFLLSYRIKSFEPFCKYKIVKSRTDTSDYTTSNELKGIGIQNSIFNIGTEENKSFNTKTLSNNISITKKPVDLAYIYTQKFYSGNKYVVDLGNLRVNTRNINIGYNLSSSEEQLFREEYYEVAPGNGSFSRDSLTGTYYQNYHGNYEKKLVPSETSSIHKNFQFANSFAFSPSTNITMKIGSIKRGEGDKVLFWERTSNAFDDRNQTNYGIQAGIVTLNFTREDYRENKLYNIPTCGEQEIWLTEARYKNLTFNYTNKSTQNYRNNIRIWKEDANTAGIGKNILNKPTLYLSVQSETRNVSLNEESPQYKFYGYNIEPSLTYELTRNSLAGNNNNFEVPATFGCKFKLTHWLGNNQMPVNIKAIYPYGITLDWDVNVTIIGKMNTNYIFSYQGNKTPTYPTDHKLNAQVQLNF